MLVTLLSARGAPGVSSWALTLATAWPGIGERVLVEADCSGGVFGTRYDVAIEPGAAELVSMARRGRFDSSLDLKRFARQVKAPDDQSGSLWVVPEPLSSHEAVDVWRAMALPTAEAMLHDERMWLADCGRVWHRSPVESLLAVAPLSIVVSDSSMPSLLVLKSRVESLPNRTAVIIIGECQYSTDDLLAFTGADYVWNVPHTRRFEALAAEFSHSSRARRSKIWRTALTIAHTLAVDPATASPGAGAATTASAPAAPIPPAKRPSGDGPTIEPTPVATANVIGEIDDVSHLVDQDTVVDPSPEAGAAEVGR